MFTNIMTAASSEEEEEEEDEEEEAEEEEEEEEGASELQQWDSLIIKSQPDQLVNQRSSRWTAD